VFFFRGARFQRAIFFHQPERLGVRFLLGVLANTKDEPEANAFRLMGVAALLLNSFDAWSPTGLGPRRIADGRSPLFLFFLFAWTPLKTADVKETENEPDANACRLMRGDRNVGRVESSQHANDVADRPVCAHRCVPRTSRTLRNQSTSSSKNGTLETCPTEEGDMTEERASRRDRSASSFLPI